MGAYAGGGGGPSLLQGGGFVNGFVNGAAAGGMSGFISGAATTGTWDGAWQGAKTGAIIGGASGGIAGGISAASNGRRFFDGARVKKKIIVDQPIPSIGQRGSANCVLACIESTDKSWGGSISQENARSWSKNGDDPNHDLVNGVDAWKAYETNNSSGHTVSGVSENSPEVVTSFMKHGDRVYIDKRNGRNGHGVMMKSVTLKTVTRLNGNVKSKYIYRIMNPTNSGFVSTISPNSIINANYIVIISK